MDTSSSVRNETTLSIPPYSFGGTASVSGAIWYLPKPSHVSTQKGGYVVNLEKKLLEGAPSWFGVRMDA